MEKKLRKIWISYQDKYGGKHSQKKLSLSTMVFPALGQFKKSFKQLGNLFLLYSKRRAMHVVLLRISYHQLIKTQIF